MGENLYSLAKPADFLTGLVFGFDVGTGSIGYAARKGNHFLSAGVLVCNGEGGDLSKRRELRRQRRTLRSRKQRRQWFAKELENIGLPKPELPPNDPITLRVRALNGDALKPAELHAALAHLFKRRGYSKVPWASLENPAKRADDAKAEDEEGTIAKVEEIKSKMGGKHPCQFLADEKTRVGKSPTEKWARTIPWPREALQREFEEIAEAQRKNFPALAERAEWLLYGDSHPKMIKEVGSFHVLFKAAEARNPGVLGLRWPRFDNRGPALDAFQPMDEHGRPSHVVRKNKDAFVKAQWELALMNFRVLDANTRQKLDPRIHFPSFVESIRNEWKKKGKVSLSRLQKLAEPFKDGFLLAEDQKPLAPESGTGRARYSSPTLNLIRGEIGSGRRVDPPQPILRREGESSEQAVNRYLGEIKNPLVRHRLGLFRRLLKQLVSLYGQPDMIVVEAVRSLALGRKAKNEIQRRSEEFRKERENARTELSSNNESISRKAIQRYRLWHEAKGRCPFCLQMIERTDLGHGADIEHLVPRSVVDCNEFYNLTVAHTKCNREIKGDRAPLAAFGGTAQWEGIRINAENCFNGRKLEIFLSPNAEELIERKSDLQHTAYIARVIRHVSLIELGWLNEEGRDPTADAGNKPSVAFQVTNGQLTSRLRKAWGLNQILHPLPSGTRWEDLTLEHQKLLTEKNRGDLRHHALDAMVIACTLPWLAHRTHGAVDALGRRGWWTQDEKQRSKAANPVFPGEGEMYRVVKAEMEKAVVRRHVSRSKHQGAYATTLYAKKGKDTYVARKVLTKLKPRNLGSIWPQDFAAYCQAAWASYEVESSHIDSELRGAHGCIPENFGRKLCFSHFQKWRAAGALGFSWPDRIKIPIRSVRLISIKDDNVVAPGGPGTHAYVERTAFKEVRVFISQDGRKFVPAMVPWWRLDRPVCSEPVNAEHGIVTTLRKGQIIDLVRPLARGYPPGRYVITKLGQVQVTILPEYLADSGEARVGHGLPESGIQPRWHELVVCLGYELPHSPSPEPRLTGAAEA